MLKVNAADRRLASKHRDGTLGRYLKLQEDVWRPYSHLVVPVDFSLAETATRSGNLPTTETGNDIAFSLSNAASL
ncbi:MAG: hypothetical protein ACLPKB_18685 [Xanthobacteraceae bacterium]